jgi:hypothetical protein
MTIKRLQALPARAVRKEIRPAKFLSVVAAFILLANCAAQGIFPNEPIPPAPPGPPAPFPTLAPPSLADESKVLTEAERAEMEAQLTKLAKDREAKIKRRIERPKQ